MKIYTKSGDKGSTSLFGGERVLKNNPLLDAYGTSDELNSSLGLVATFTKDSPTKNKIISIQHQLFNIGSHLACGDEKLRAKLPELKPAAITALEEWIDQMESELTPLTQFILPGGSPEASHAHLSRTICRRFERQLVGIESFPQLDFILMYVNRLSDALFVCARHLNHRAGQADILWEK